MIAKLLTEHPLEFLSLKGDGTGSSESTHVKMPHCWKSHALAQLSCLSVKNYVNFFFVAVSSLLLSLLFSWKH